MKKAISATQPHDKPQKVKLPESELEHGKKSQSKQKLTLENVRALALLRYYDYNGFARAVGGISRSMAYQLLNGLYLPKKPKTIEKIAQTLGISPVELERVFQEAQS